MRKALDLKPLEFGDVLGRSVSLYTSALAGFIGWFALAWTLPMISLTLLLYMLLEPYGTAGIAEEQSIWAAGPYAAYVWLLQIAAIFLGFGVGAAGVYYLAARLYVGASPTFGEVAKAVQARAGALLSASTLHVLALLGITFLLLGFPIIAIIDGAVMEGAMFLFLLGILWVGLILWYLGACQLNVPCVMLDDSSAGESFGRSLFLTSRFRLRVIGLILTTMLIVGAPGVPGLMTAPAIAGAYLLKEFPLTADLIYVAWQGALLPLFFIPLTVFYFDMRCRKEGYDLAVMARNFGIEEGEMLRYGMNPGLGYDPAAAAHARRRAPRALKLHRAPSLPRRKP
jgi:hypothetical protein